VVLNLKRPLTYTTTIEGKELVVALTPVAMPGDVAASSNAYSFARADSTGGHALRDLMDHATQRTFVHAHAWRAGDLVIWDNLATMHRGRPFDDGIHRRELRRVTTLDIAAAPA
jgi:hypothetical protein